MKTKKEIKMLYDEFLKNATLRNRVDGAGYTKYILVNSDLFNAFYKTFKK